MLQKPNLGDDRIVSCLRDSYGVAATALEFLPIGNDSSAWVYRVGSDDGETYFLKVRKGRVHEISLAVPRHLKDSGMTQVVAPIPPLAGDSAMERGLSDVQWVEYGAIFRKLHATGLSDAVLRTIPRDTFVSSWCQGVQRLQAAIAALDDPDHRSQEAAWLIVLKQPFMD